MDKIAQRTTLRSVLLTKYNSSDKMKIMIWAGYVALVGERRCESKVLVRRFEGKRPLGKRKPRW